MASEPTRAPDRASPLLIGAGSVLSLIFMAHHPSTGASGIADAVAEMSREASISRAVHGGLIAVLSAVFLGFLGLSDYLGPRLVRVRAASLAYGLGVAFMTLAAMVSGFLVPGLASRYAGAPVPELEALGPVLRLCYETNQSMAKAGTVALSVAIFLWSWTLLGRGTAARAIGALGLLVGVVPVLGLAGGHLDLDVHGMGAVMLGQAVWSVAVAIWWARTRRPSSPAQAGIE